MKKIIIILMALFACLIATYIVAAEELPLATKSGKWQYLVNNAFRTADNYAMKRNPSCTFACNKQNEDIRLVRQEDGVYKGQWLLMITCRGKMGTAFAVLHPNFDVNKKSDNTDDSDVNIWTVVLAKFNGKEF